MDLKENAAKKEINIIFFEWIETITTHGFPNIFRNKIWLLRTFWILCVSCSCSYCIFNLTTIFKDFFDYKVNTKITNERMGSIQFPTVSFCNRNPFNLKKNHSEIGFYLELIKKLKIESFNLAKIYNNTNSIEKEMFFLISRVLLNYTKTEIAPFSFGIDEMLINCEFNGITCSKNDFESFFLSEYGNCYKFNSGKNLFGNKTRIQNSEIPGKQNGLRLELFSGFLDKDVDFIRSSGIHLFIHNHSTVIYSEYDSISLSNGFETDIVVSQEHTTKLSKPYSNCITDPTSLNSFYSDLYKKTIKLFGRYQQKTCLIMCYHDYIKSNYGCYYPGAVEATSETLCEYQVFLKARNAYKDFSKTGQSLRCFDMCPIECNNVKYTFKISQANFPTPFYSQLMIENQKYFPNEARNFDNYETVKESVLAVNVYHDDIALTIIEESPAMSLIQLIGNIGGILGICVGMSILSFAEIFHLFLKILLRFFEIKKQTKVFGTGL